MTIANAAITHDAVIVIPGIMGSALVDSESATMLWGAEEASWWIEAWTTGNAINGLAVTDDERSGRVNRVRAVGLLRFPAFAPVLRGFEPYTKLVSGITKVLPHRDALCEFPYDWRLSVEHNAGELAKTVSWHLSRWRAHSMGSANAKVVLVAHSMGGLIARYFTNVLGGADDVRTTVTLGTPYYGSVKAAQILASGRGTPIPLPHARLRRLVATMPGLHDLLPFYRCIDEGRTARVVTPADIAEIGGDHELAAASVARHERLMSGPAGNLRLVVGVEQPSMQSISISNGQITPLMYTCHVDAAGEIVRREDLAGDSTVFRRSAAAFNLPAMTLPQSHGALAATDEAIAHVRDVLVNDIAGPPLGSLTKFGVAAPDIIALGEPLTVNVNGSVDAAGISCRIFDAFSERQAASPPLQPHGDGLSATFTLLRPGVYRVEVKAGGSSAVTHQVMALDTVANKLEAQLQ